MLIAIKIGIVIFVTEALIMLVAVPMGLTDHSERHGVAFALIDAFLLTVVASPIIYLWVIRPYVRERDRAQAGAVVARQEAERANQIKATWLASMGHELRTPLNAIIGFSDVLKAQMYGPLGAAKYTEYAAAINDSGNHLLGIINDLLDVSKAEAGKIEVIETAFDPSGLIADSVRILTERARDKNIVLTQDLPPDLPEIWADERLCRQIMLNILSNAVKYTPENGAVNVSAAVRSDGLAITIRDTGIGMDRDQLANVTKPFWRAGSVVEGGVEGTGLGLSLCVKLIEMHQGRLEIDSQLNKGTAVTVVFPSERLAASDPAEREGMGIGPAAAGSSPAVSFDERQNAT